MTDVDTKAGIDLIYATQNGNQVRLGDPQGLEPGPGKVNKLWPDEKPWKDKDVVDADSQIKMYPDDKPEDVYVLSPFHANQIVDLDGDCVPDMVLVQMKQGEDPNT